MPTWNKACVHQNVLPWWLLLAGVNGVCWFPCATSNLATLGGRCKDRVFGVILPKGERICPLRGMSPFGMRKESWNVKNFCKTSNTHKLPVWRWWKGVISVCWADPNHWAASHTSPLNLCHQILHAWWLHVLLLPYMPTSLLRLSLAMQKQSEENCCTSNAEASPKRINLFGFDFWEFIIFFI